MPQSIGRQPRPASISNGSPASPRRTTTPAPKAASSGWAPSASATARKAAPRSDAFSSKVGEQLERWRTLRADVMEPVAYRTPGRRTEEQKMDDTLISYGLAEPMWPQLAAMGFEKPEAAVARAGLKSFETMRRTSLQPYGAGLERLQPTAKRVADLAKVVDALRQGRSADAAIAKLPAAHANLLRRQADAFDSPLLRAVRLLENDLGQLITDNPAELLDVAPEKVQAGMAFHCAPAATCQVSL